MLLITSLSLSAYVYVSLYILLVACECRNQHPQPKQIRHTELVFVSFDLWSMVFSVWFLDFVWLSGMKISRKRAKHRLNRAHGALSGELSAIFSFDRVIFFFGPRKCQFTVQFWYKLAHFLAYYCCRHRRLIRNNFDSFCYISIYLQFSFFLLLECLNKRLSIECQPIRLEKHWNDTKITLLSSKNI